MKLNRKTKIGIQAKLTGIMLAITLLPLAFLGFQAFNVQKQMVIDEVKHSHMELSNILAYGIYNNLESTRKLMRAITTLDSVKKLNTDIIEDFFYALMNHFSFFQSMYMIDDKKKIIAPTDSNIKLPDNWLYTNAVKRSYQGALSKVFKEPNGEPYINLESIVRSPQKRGIVGVIISKVNLGNIQNILHAALRDSKSQGIVFDERGTIVAKSSPDVENYAGYLPEYSGKDVTRLKSFNGKSYLITAISLKKFDFYQAPNWTIVLRIPADIAFNKAYQFKKYIVSVLIFTALFSILLSFFLARRFVSPLKGLIMGSKFISNGDFSHEIQIESNDEIGELATTFDEMRINLRDTEADLEYRVMQLSTLYEVGQAISSILDFKLLQNTILETSVKVVKAEKGSIMLLDETDKVLTIGVAIGLSDEITSNTKVGIGESISGWVIDNGSPLFIKDVENSEKFASIKRENAKKGSMICVPLIAKEKILGTLNVSKSQANSFTEKDFELFSSLSHQAAIAIENARLYRYAVTDGMTRLYNHRYFQHRLDEEIQRADRYASRVSLIMLDVDHFKGFNDTYGHPEGDRVLKAISRILENSVREIDICSRYGGEEFVVICPEKTGEGAMTPAERIREATENFDFRIKGKRIPITVSIGVACYPEQAQNQKELISKADCALYYSKNNGRNRSTLFNAIMQEH